VYHHSPWFGTNSVDGGSTQLSPRLDWSPLGLLEHIKMNVRFQALLGLGAGLDFPASLIYVSAIYTASIATILWLGLVIYLTMTGGLRIQGLLRELLVILLVVIPSLTTGIFLTGLLLSPVAAYLTTWLPLFFASWLSMRVARRSISVDVVD
jgi:hypothetical protein